MTEREPTAESAPEPDARGRERWARSVLVLFLMLVGAAVTEAALAAARSPFTNRLAIGIAAALHALLFALALSLLFSALLVALAALRARLLHFAVSAAKLRALAIDLAAAALMVLPLLAFAVARAELALRANFKNAGLIAWSTGLFAIASCLLAGLAVGLFALAFNRLRARHAPKRPALRGAIWLPGLLSASGMGALAFREAGLFQLDWALVLAPISVLVSVPVVRRLERFFPRRSLVCLEIVSIASIAAAVAAHLALGTALSALSAHGAWARPVLSGLRGVTDFDADGHSGWFSGGDCAPFDRSVHPGAVEVPRDGVDNNCMAGDGGNSLPVAPPRAHGALPFVPERPNLLLVSIETLRADRVSLLGYSRPTTPRLQELAKDSVVFEKVYSTAPATRLSLAALLSGRLPSALSWLPQAQVKQMRRMAPDTPWLPARLRESGYYTLAVHTDFRAFTATESAGFDRGFERYDTSTRLRFVGGTMEGFPGEAQVNRALTLLGEAGERPWFLWIHLMEPHFLYQQPPQVERFGNDEASLYDAEIAEADRQVGRLAQALRSRGLYDGTLILVVGDHGEEFGEHGARFHGSNLYEAQVRTVALLRIPGLAARRVAAPVSLLDFAPTLLDLMGLRDGFDQLMGRNLVPVVAGGALEPGLFLESFRVDDGTEALLAVVDWPLKLIYNQGSATFELYDLEKDPLERRNLHVPGNPQARPLEERLYRYLESSTRRGTHAAREFRF